MSESFTGWRKSGYSEPDDACVEVGHSPARTIGVRDSKASGTGPVLEFAPTAWAAFVKDIRRAR